MEISHWRLKHQRLTLQGKICNENKCDEALFPPRPKCYEHSVNGNGLKIDMNPLNNPEVQSVESLGNNGNNSSQPEIVDTTDVPGSTSEITIFQDES